MSRPTRITIDTSALLHNLARVKQLAPGSPIIAMVKANAYGCGQELIAPALEGKISAFGVACLEEALIIRSLGIKSPCILFQGVFGADELQLAAAHQLQVVIHHREQLQWLLATPLPLPLKIWVKVDTGMHRLGFAPEEIYELLIALQTCPWVEEELGLLTHLACADEPGHPSNQAQLKLFRGLSLPDVKIVKSIYNSAGILSLAQDAREVVRPGLMLYGLSPFAFNSGQELGLRPVVSFSSALTVIHTYPKYSKIGYGGIWETQKASRIGVIPVGYGDGYPRHVASSTCVSIKGQQVPIVGRISMDVLTVDLSACPSAAIGDEVELWGKTIPLEPLARGAGTISYELLCQLKPRRRVELST